MYEDFEEDENRTSYSDEDGEQAIKDLADSRNRIIKKKNQLKVLKNIPELQSEDELYKFLHESQD